MEGFTFASALDLNMGYYHIKLGHNADAQKLYTIVFPWNIENTNTNGSWCFSKLHVKACPRYGIC
jgi:hypothetical protein